jgi:hypothetical protein
MMFESYGLACDRHKKVAGLNRLMRSLPSVVVSLTGERKVAVSLTGERRVAVSITDERRVAVSLTDERREAVSLIGLTLLPF